MYPHVHFMKQDQILPFELVTTDSGKEKLPISTEFIAAILSVYLVQAVSPVTSLLSGSSAFMTVPLSGAYSMTWAIVVGQFGMGAGGSSQVSVTTVVLTAITSRSVGAGTESVYVHMNRSIK